MEVCVEVLKRIVQSPVHMRESSFTTQVSFRIYIPSQGSQVRPSAGQVYADFSCTLIGMLSMYCKVDIKVCYQINACYPMTSMMGVSILRKIELCGHGSCAGLLITQIGHELTLFPYSNTNVPVVRLTLLP